MKVEYWVVLFFIGESEFSGFLLWYFCFFCFVFLRFFLCLMNLGLVLFLSIYFFVLGENVREFFFRVVVLIFEVNVLVELEKSGVRRIGDVVRECLFG